MEPVDRHDQRGIAVLRHSECLFGGRLGDWADTYNPYPCWSTRARCIISLAIRSCG